jgi:hypothetical protein
LGKTRLKSKEKSAGKFFLAFSLTESRNMTVEVISEPFFGVIFEISQESLSWERITPLF